MTDKEQEKQAPAYPDAVAPGVSGAARAVDAQDLLGRDGAVTIRHRGQTYVLRETRQGKLILNK